jgi:hypothetical protein
MTTDLDERLRAALHAVPRETPGAHLAGAALAGARRRRRHGVAGLVALVAVLAAAAVTVPALVFHRAPGAQTAGPALGRFVVAGYASRDPQATTLGLGRSEVYQRSAGGYAVAPGRRAVPSPDGRTVALISDQGRVGLVPADRVLDPDAVRWITVAGPAQAPVGDAVWSPDSRRVLMLWITRITASETTSTALMVDADTLAVHQLRLPRAAYIRKPAKRLVFGPRGDGVAMIDPAGPDRGILEIWPDSGQRWNLSVRALSLPDQPFSPSGWLLAGYDGYRSTVVDIASGGEPGTVDGQVAGWYDEDRLVVMVGRSVRVVDYRSGKVFAERQLAAAGRVLTGVWLAPVRGAAPDGAIVL